MAVASNAGPVAVTPVGLLESKWLWMGTRSHDDDDRDVIDEHAIGMRCLFSFQHEIASQTSQLRHGRAGLATARSLMAEKSIAQYAPW